VQEYKNLLKLNIPSKTISKSFLVMNRQIWTNQKRHRSTANADEQASALCALCGKVENTMHLLFECARCSEPLWELVREVITALIIRPPRQHKHTAFMLIVRFTTFMMDRFHGSMPVRLWQGSKKSKET
jgi:hypothetical protein